MPILLVLSVKKPYNFLYDEKYPERDPRNQFRLRKECPRKEAGR
jgi:hypothetical protein